MLQYCSNYGTIFTQERTLLWTGKLTTNSEFQAL